ncbi:hypothetical protein KR084_011775, partial [Drosophila pseudotakahashii]
VQASRYTRNKDIQNRYNIKSAQEAFDDASGRLANSLFSHPNVEAQNLLLNLFIPNSQDSPIYTKQIDTHFVPLQQQLLLQPIIR